MLKFSVCGAGGGGGRGLFFVVVVFNVSFEFKAKHHIIFLPNKQNLEEYFIDNIVNANIFI